MKGLKPVGRALAGAAAIAALAAGLIPSPVAAQDATASISSVELATGEQGTVALQALNIADPGLGAWSINITYDPDVVSAVSCESQIVQEGDVVGSGFCNPAFDDDVVRVAGATATGLVGDTTLASVIFACGDAEGTSDLTLSLDVFADATVGGPQSIDAAIEHGTIICGEGGATSAEGVTDTAGADSDDSDGGSALVWVIVGLVAAGLAAAAGFGVLRLRARRS